MTRYLLAIWGLWSLAMAALLLPEASRAYARDTDGYGLALALLLWALSLANSAVGGSCLAAAIWPKK